MKTCEKVISLEKMKNLMFTFSLFDEFCKKVKAEHPKRKSHNLLTKTSKGCKENSVVALQPLGAILVKCRKD